MHATHISLKTGRNEPNRAASGLSSIWVTPFPEKPSLVSFSAGDKLISTS
jgi:hypothetical protein